MNYLKKTILVSSLLSLMLSPLFSQNKHLILAEGNSWKPMMASNLIQNYKTIEKLPFSGFVVLGNSFTKEVMREGVQLNYQRVWNELKGLKNLYKNKRVNFLQINLDFPADFWNDEAWNNVANNFSVVAKVAKNLGFKGIVFDDEPYTLSSHKMNNFKFPTKKELTKNSTKWEKKGSEYGAWVDEKGYRNPKYSFQEHITKVTQHFKKIMQAMLKEYPSLTLLVYNGASFAHINSNKEHILITDVGLPREHEYKGAMFAGLVEGLNSTASLHDMGESYKYRNDTHFKRSYQWRKYDIAKDFYNDSLDSTFQWTVPKKARKTWSNKVQVGFMVFNKGQASNHKEFDTRQTSSITDIKATLKKALQYSDKYIVYYCQDQDWLLPNQKHPLPVSWMKMMKEVSTD